VALASLHPLGFHFQPADFPHCYPPLKATIEPSPASVRKGLRTMGSWGGLEFWPEWAWHALIGLHRPEGRHRSAGSRGLPQSFRGLRTPTVGSPATGRGSEALSRCLRFS
jgi:hypothetical protein